MTYVIEPSTFGIGYSIFLLKVVDGATVKTYVADVPTVEEGRTLCVGATEIICTAEESYRSQLKVNAA